MHTYQSLATRYHTFVYEDFAITQTDKRILVSFRYSNGHHRFRHQVIIPYTGVIDEQRLTPFCFYLGLVEAISYWKLTAAPTIECRAGNLTQDQQSWWHTLIIEGMGEYFYKNNINFTVEHFLSIKNSEKTVLSNNKKLPNSDLPGTQNTEKSSHREWMSSKKNNAPSLLIPIGGGKDSATTLGLLQEYTDYPLTALCINPTQAALDIAEIAQLNCLRVTRTFDPLLLQLNSQGFLNGHVPVSASIAFISCLVGYLYNHTHVVLANEASANEGNVKYYEHSINHQYSKSYTFETNFQRYAQEYLPDSPFYFSLLRPFNELQIGKLFSQYPRFHQAFRSCNRGSKHNTWCGECSKCLFAWIMLYPFFETGKLTQFFGENLFSKESLWSTLTSLVKKNETKPFDCVGTKEESIIALYLALKKHNWKNLPIVLERASKELIELETNLDQRASDALLYWNTEQSVPDFLLHVLKPLPHS